MKDIKQKKESKLMNMRMQTNILFYKDLSSYIVELIKIRENICEYLHIRD